MKNVQSLEEKFNEFRKLINGDSVLLFLKSINMDQYYNLFNQQGFHTINDLECITKDTLQDMGINKVAHYTKILNAIKKYKNNNDNNGESNML